MTKNTAGEMWLYLWSDVDDVAECKFGERFVKPGQNPEAEIRKRVRASVGVRKDRFDEGKIRIVSTWNVSKLARKIERNYKGARVDDWMREQIGYRKGTTGEIHTLPGDEMAIRVNTLITKLGAPLPLANLSQPQATELLNVKRHFDAGHQVVLAELCARFGKTIWSGALAREMDMPLTVVATYVQTVTTSFLKDLTSFQQWADHVHVDTKDEDYQDRINDALREGKKVVAYLSLCTGTKREERISYLAKKRVPKLVVIDEADFGAHRKGQVDALAPFRKSSKVLLMTGTNGDRASALWALTAAVSVVYPELLVAKERTKQEGAKIRKQRGLTHFRVDTGRHLLYPDVSLYQANLKSVVDFALANDPALFNDGKDNLPSWSKFAANPIKAKGFFVTMLRAAFNGELSLDDISVDNQLGVTGPRVRMMFLPGSTKNANMRHIVQIAQDTLDGWKVVALYGEETSNRKAERVVKEAVEKATTENQGVLILSAGMASRSFSVGEIEEVYLAYDSGDIGATIQKISRALTPNGQGKIGRIISLSFDPNRDDKFDSIMLEAAKNLTEKEDTDIQQALKQVFRSIDLFRFSDNGAVEITQDEYLRGMLDVRRISRVIGATADLSGLTKHALCELAAGNSDYFRQARTRLAKKGKTFLPNSSSQRRLVGQTDPTKQELAKAREVIASVVEHFDIILFGTNTNTVRQALEAVDKDLELQLIVREEFGISWQLVAYLFESNIINSNLVELRIIKER